MSILYTIFLVLLFVLKIIFILFCIMLGTLFIPLKYKINVNYLNDKYIVLNVFIGILFNFLEIYYDDKLKIKILGFEIKKNKDNIYEKNLKYENKLDNDKISKGFNEEKKDFKSNNLHNEYLEKDIENNIKIKKEKNLSDIKKKYEYIKSIIVSLNSIKKEAFIFLMRVLKRFKIVYFNLFGEIGFDTPDDTGKFLALTSIFKITDKFDVNFKGNFNEKIYNINLKTKGKINMGLILIDTLRFIFTRSVLKIVRKLLIKILK